MADHAYTTDGSRRRRDPASVTLDARTRARLEDAAERIIAALDALDGDPDAEPDPDGEVEPAEAREQPMTLAPDQRPDLYARRIGA